MMMLAAAHIAKRKGKPFQLLPVLSMMAWMTLGPIIEDARLDSPKSPKNWASIRNPERAEKTSDAHHVIETWGRELRHHSL